MSAVSSELILVGFVAKRDIDGEWSFEQKVTNYLDIETAFEQLEKAKYVLIGLYQPMGPGLPPFLACIIPHNLKYSEKDFSEWVEKLQKDWIKASLPIVNESCDMDSKNLNRLLNLVKKREGSLGLKIDRWFTYASKGPHNFYITGKGDPAHGLNLFRNQLLKLQKFVPTGKGIISIQFIHELIKDGQCRAIEDWFNEHDRQNVQYSLQMGHPSVRRALLNIGNRKIQLESGEEVAIGQSNLPIVVYSFISETLYQVYYSLCDHFSIAERIKMLGAIEEIFISWRTYVLQCKKYTLKKNFLAHHLQNSFS